MTKQESQVLAIRAIFYGSSIDKDGYRGCPNCGSRQIFHDGITLDHCCISCIQCNFSITGNDHYKLIRRWNNINRWSFQLELPFPEM